MRRRDIPPRVASYARAAAPDRAGSSAIAQQAAGLPAFARERSGTVPPERIDRDAGVSGMRLHRTALGRLGEAVARREIDAVLAAGPDRPARGGAALIQVLDDCARAGCDVFFARQPRSAERTTS